MPIEEDTEYGMIGTCDICGERFNTASRHPSLSEVGEMCDPEVTPGAYGEEFTRGIKWGIVHGQCGIDKGWQMA